MYAKYILYTCAHTHIHMNTKALPNKARGCWELCHKERWRLEVTRILLPALQKSRSLHNLQSPAASQERSQQGERCRECRGLFVF